MNELINNAMNMINSHDWFWEMCDYGYNENKKSAENHKNQFVVLLNSINDNKIISLLRNIWIAKYKLASASIANIQTSEYKNQIENLTNELNSITYKN